MKTAPRRSGNQVDSPARLAAPPGPAVASMIAGARAAQLTMVTVSSSYPAFGHVTRWSPGLAHPVALTLQEAVCGFMSASHNSRSQTRTNLSSTRWCDVPTVGLIYASSMVLVDSAHRKAPVPALTLAAAIRACSSARTGRVDRLPGARRLPRGRAERRGDVRAASGHDAGVTAARRACSPVLPLVLLPAPATAGAGAARGRRRSTVNTDPQTWKACGYCH